jgi:thiamine-phosphate diphosphorylase
MPRGMRVLGHGLYGIADADACRAAGREVVAVARALARGGAVAVQLRMKGAGAGELLEAAREVGAACRAAGCLFVVNDRPDVARLAGADGVHLGQEDVPVAAARAAMGEGWVGVSTHDDAELAQALEDGADYVGWGPVFATASKAGALPARGLELLRAAVARVGGRVPVVAIGGITAEKAPAVAAAGARAWAVIGDVAGAADLEERIRALARAGEAR